MIHTKLVALEVKFWKSENIAATTFALMVGVSSMGIAFAMYGSKSNFPTGTLLAVLTYITCMCTYHRHTFGIGHYYSAAPKQVNIRTVPVLTDVIPTTNIGSVERHFWLWFWTAPFALLGLAVLWNWDKLIAFILFA